MPGVAQRRLGVTLAVLVLAGGLAGRAGAHAQSTLPTACAAASPGTPGASTEFVAAANHFGFRLLHYLLTREKSANVFISPTSAEIALAMTEDGARSSTAEAVAATLGLQGMSRDRVLDQAAALLTSLASVDPQVQLDLANALWVRSQFPIIPGFLEHARHYYGARVTTLDFASPDAIPTINGWVSCATHGMITSIIKRIPSRVVLYLMNATYFHGLWTLPFDPKRTASRPFTRGDGSQTPMPIMLQ